MASSSSSSSSAIANQYCCSLVILLTLLSSLQIQARDNQFFNKVSATNNYQPQQQHQPNFIPENENTYGLYSHDSTHLPPSSTTVDGGAATPATAIPSNKYLPKNYNPVAYVTEPDNISEKDTFNEERNVNSNPENNDNGEQNYYNRNEEDSEFRRFRRPKTTHSRNTYYNGGSSFNSEPEGFRGGDAGRERYFNSGSESNGFEPQGMSDTRFLENGKYYYDVDNEKFNSNHPYERLKNTRARNEYNNDNNRNYYEFNGENSMEGYQNEEFQDEENYNLP